MRKYIIVSTLLGFWILIFGFFFYGCGTTVNIPSSSGAKLFYTNVASTAPVFEPSSASLQSVTLHSTSEWGAGNPLYPVYFSLREFLSERDEGKVDRSNLYKMLIDVDTVYTSGTADAVSITEQAITPPFSSLPSLTCNQAVNDTANKQAIALKSTDNQINAILGWIWTDSPLKNEYGVAVVSFETATKDITVDMTYSVDYNLSTTATDYNLRCSVSGNVDSNEFQFKYIIGDAKIVAKGISRGEGNYMLFKYTGYGSTVKYIVVPGTADEDYFMAQNTSLTNIYTNPDDLPATVAAYKDWVVNTTFLGTAEMVTDSSTLNSGNSKAGTIYINYN